MQQAPSLTKFYTSCKASNISSNRHFPPISQLTLFCFVFLIKFLCDISRQLAASITSVWQGKVTLKMHHTWQDPYSELCLLTSRVHQLHWPLQFNHSWRIEPNRLVNARTSTTPWVHWINSDLGCDVVYWKLNLEGKSCRNVARLRLCFSTVNMLVNHFPYW